MRTHRYWLIGCGYPRNNCARSKTRHSFSYHKFTPHSAKIPRDDPRKTEAPSPPPPPAPAAAPRSLQLPAVAARVRQSIPTTPMSISFTNTPIFYRNNVISQILRGTSYRTFCRRATQLTFQLLRFAVTEMQALYNSHFVSAFSRRLAPLCAAPFSLPPTFLDQSDAGRYRSSPEHV